MIEHTTDHSIYLQFESLAAYPELSHAVFTRQRGFSAAPFAGLNASAVTGDDQDIVRRNKAEIVAALGLPLVGAKPVHGATVTTIDRHTAETAAHTAWLEALRAQARQTEADAMLAHEPGFALCWAYGDCAPILYYDPRHRAYALGHAGWRGTAAGIAAQTVTAMRERYGSSPAEILVGVGPAIGSCCYAVSEQVYDTFSRNPLAFEHARFEQRTDADGANPQLYLDIAASNYGQLLEAGIHPDHIEMSGYCTGCRTDLFYSHRREPWPSGRFAVGIGLREA